MIYKLIKVLLIRVSFSLFIVFGVFLFFRILQIVIEWPDLQKVVFMFHSVFAVGAEIEVLTFTACISYPFNWLHATVITFKLRSLLINFTT